MMEFKDLLDHKAMTDPLALKAMTGLLDHKGMMDSLDPKAMTDPLDLRAMRDSLDKSFRMKIHNNRVCLKNIILYNGLLFVRSQNHKQYLFFIVKKE
jgi:hypothetical protein